jgi:hypothetical protein
LPRLAPIGSAAEDLARVQELTGVSPVRPETFRRWSNPDAEIRDFVMRLEHAQAYLWASTSFLNRETESCGTSS